MLLTKKAPNASAPVSAAPLGGAKRRALLGVVVWLEDGVTSPDDGVSLLPAREEKALPSPALPPPLAVLVVGLATTELEGRRELAPRNLALEEISLSEPEALRPLPTPNGLPSPECCLPPANAKPRPPCAPLKLECIDEEGDRIRPDGAGDGGTEGRRGEVGERRVVVFGLLGRSEEEEAGDRRRAAAAAFGDCPCCSASRGDEDEEREARPTFADTKRGLCPDHALGGGGARVAEERRDAADENEAGERRATGGPLFPTVVDSAAVHCSPPPPVIALRGLCGIVADPVSSMVGGCCGGEDEAAVKKRSQVVGGS